MKWPEKEEAAFRRSPHRWTFNERLMVGEIDALRAALRKLLPDTAALAAMHLELPEIVISDISKNIEDAKALLGEKE